MNASLEYVEVALSDRLLEIGKDCAVHLKEPFRCFTMGHLLYDEERDCHNDSYTSAVRSQSFAMSRSAPVCEDNREGRAPEHLGG